MTGGFHEGVAPDGTKEPWLVYSLHYAPYDFAWGQVSIEAGFDIFVFSKDQVEARNLDQLVTTVLHDASLNVEGQTVLFARRLRDVSNVEINDDGRRVYMVGGIYEVETNQDL